MEHRECYKCRTKFPCTKVGLKVFCDKCKDKQTKTKFDDDYGNFVQTIVTTGAIVDSFGDN